MSGKPPDPNYDDSRRSPHDEASNIPEGESVIPWKAPVIAAVLGALAVATFTVYAIVTGPALEEVVDAPSSTALVVTIQERAEGLPPGYTPIAGEVGARVEAVTVSSRAARVAVSNAVIGSADPSEVTPIDVAYWELDGVDGVVPMIRQYGDDEVLASVRRPGASGWVVGLTGNWTVEFPPDVAMEGATLLAYVVDGVVEMSTTVEVPPGARGDVGVIRIDMGGGVTFVVKPLVVGDGWGYITWRVDGGTTGRLKTDVSLVRADGSVIEYPHGADSFDGSFAYRGASRLANWEPNQSDGTSLSAIRIDIRVQIPERVRDPIVLEVPWAGLIPSLATS